MPTAARKKRGPVQNRRGRPDGYRVTEATREKLRAKIKGDRVLEILHDIAEGGDKHDAARVTAAKVLLDRILPTLQSTDLTSNGESITVERVAFKANGK